LRCWKRRTDFSDRRDLYLFLVVLFLAVDFLLELLFFTELRLREVALAIVW